MPITQRTYQQSELCRAAKERLRAEDEALQNSKRLKAWRRRYIVYMAQQTNLPEGDSLLENTNYPLYLGQ